MPRIRLLTTAPQSFDPLLAQLMQRGDDVETFSESDRLFEEAEESPADLILLDPTLPTNQGYEVCQRVKDSTELDLVPVIMVHPSGSLNGSVLKGLQAGADDVVSLEGQMEEVLARIDSALRVRQRVSQCKNLAQQMSEMNSELYERNIQVEKELYVTRQLQQSLLPPILKEDAEGGQLSHTPRTTEPNTSTHLSKCHHKDSLVRITGVYLPCDALGGDIYDVIKFADGSVGVAIADVSGHGVPAGFITAIFKSSLYRTTLSKSHPKEIIYQLNNELNEIVKTGEYVTAFYCRITPGAEGSGSCTVDYTGAGHPYPLYYSAATGSIERLQENGTPLVWIRDMEYPSGTLTLSPGDRVLLFTDGVSEMRSANGDMFGEDQLEELFQAQMKSNPAQTLEGMIQTLSDFTQGHPLEDDLSMVLIEAL